MQALDILRGRASKRRLAGDGTMLRVEIIAALAAVIG